MFGFLIEKSSLPFGQKRLQTSAVCSKSLPGGVARDPLAQRYHPAGHLVAEDLRVGPPELGHVELAAPLVQI